VVCLRVARDFGSVGQFFRDFGQVSDDEVTALLADWQARPG
jgi:predicted phosphoribosyltransferase